VTTRSRERLTHILESARHVVRNPRRSLFYGVYLAEYLADADAVAAPCFRDHRRKRVSLIPAPARPAKPPRFAAAELQQAAGVC